MIRHSHLNHLLSRMPLSPLLRYSHLVHCSSRWSDVSSGDFLFNTLTKDESAPNILVHCSLVGLVIFPSGRWDAVRTSKVVSTELCWNMDCECSSYEKYATVKGSCYYHTWVYIRVHLPKNVATGDISRAKATTWPKPHISSWAFTFSNKLYELNLLL